MIFWMIFREVLDLIPEKVRKIIGSILLIFGTVLFLLAYFGDWGSGLEGIGGLAALIVGLSSIVLGLIFLMHRRLDLFYWDESDDEKDLAKNLIMKNRKQQIDCSSCNQKLNIPFSYSGNISCPACGINMELEEGIIQAGKPFRSGLIGRVPFDSHTSVRGAHAFSSQSFSTQLRNSRLPSLQTPQHTCLHHLQNL